jgi:pyruvate dehydrogenase E2 component (dihydrolipoamide acetyltransferase)
MSTTVSMPQLGETVTEGTILRWAKQVGDTVAEDEVLVEISTDKVDTEVPSPAAGTILEILVAEGETVEVGTGLVVIGEAGEEPAGSGASEESEPQQDSQPEAPAQSETPEPQPESAPEPQPESQPESPRASQSPSQNRRPRLPRPRLRVSRPP